MLEMLEICHLLQRDHSISQTEFYSMIPWMLEIKLAQIERDIQEEAERVRKKSSANMWT